MLMVVLLITCTTRYGCHGAGGNQGFRWHEDTGRLQDWTQNTCLTIEPAADDRFILKTERCVDGNKYQEWRVVPPHK